MKKLSALLLLFVAVLLVSCGGGGGGGGDDGGGPGGGPGGSTGALRIEAVLANDPGQRVDPLNIQVGETVQFVVASYDAAGNRTLVGSGQFASTDVNDTVGNLTPTGLLEATASSSQAFTVTTTAQGQNLSASYLVKPVQALVTGFVRDSNGRPVAGAFVVVVGASGNEVARGRTLGDGFFRISSPTSGVEVNLEPATLSNTVYYASFLAQDGRRYTTLDHTCSAPIPNLVVGATASAGTLVVETQKTLGGADNLPPPPPDGCF